MRERALLERVLAALADAPRTPFRLVQLATVSPDGTPALRTVVLRGFRRAPMQAEFHADARAPKIRAIEAVPAVELLAWAPDEKLQVRMRGAARVHVGDDVAGAGWAALSGAARATYELQALPGAAVTDAQAEARVADGFAQFAVLRVAIDGLDILELGPEGAQFRIQAGSDGAPPRRVGP